MSESIIRILSREITRAFRNGIFAFAAFGKAWRIEHVNGSEYRLTDECNHDCGLRFLNDHGKLSFFLA